jgi:hypothetical protein
VIFRDVAHREIIYSGFGIFVVLFISAVIPPRCRADDTPVRDKCITTKYETIVTLSQLRGNFDYIHFDPPHHIEGAEAEGDEEKNEDYARKQDFHLRVPIVKSAVFIIAH